MPFLRWQEGCGLCGASWLPGFKLDHKIKLSAPLTDTPSSHFKLLVNPRTVTPESVTEFLCVEHHKSPEQVLLRGLAMILLCFLYLQLLLLGCSGPKKRAMGLLFAVDMLGPIWINWSFESFHQGEMRALSVKRPVFLSKMLDIILQDR